MDGAGSDPSMLAATRRKPRMKTKHPVALRLWLQLYALTPGMLALTSQFCNGFGIGADFAAVGLPGRRDAVTGRARTFRCCIHEFSFLSALTNRPHAITDWHETR